MKAANCGEDNQHDKANNNITQILLIGQTVNEAQLNKPH